MIKRIITIFIVCISVGFFWWIASKNSAPIVHANDIELLTTPWHLNAHTGPSERYQYLQPHAFRGSNTLSITYNLHGLCLLEGDASAIVIDQPLGTWHYISLYSYGTNCLDGEQTVLIPLSDFSGLDLGGTFSSIHTRIWHRVPFVVDITSLKAVGTPSVLAPTYTIIPTHTPIPLVHTPTLTQIPTCSPLQVTPTQSPTPVFLPTSTPINTAMTTPSITPSPPPIVELPIQSSRTFTWDIQSVSSMKETKDRVCTPRPVTFIDTWMDMAVDLGANYVAVETPYDSPACADAQFYTRAWIYSARAHRLSVWHRHMPIAFEGLYGVPKKIDTYYQMIGDYIRNNSAIFASGDIFTPIPEPQNGGIHGVTYCDKAICQFRNAAEFNTWLRTAMDVANQAFKDIGLGGKVKVGYYGFDGFVAWGDNNQHWDGILEDETVAKMGNITIDHYPQLVGDTMQNDLDELESKYPGVPIIIGEWGTVTGGNVGQQVVYDLSAAMRPSIKGFNYWHAGMGGHEALVNEDFSKRTHFADVQSFYKGLR